MLAKVEILPMFNVANPRYWIERSAQKSTLLEAKPLVRARYPAPTSWRRKLLFALPWLSPQCPVAHSKQSSGSVVLSKRNKNKRTTTIQHLTPEIPVKFNRVFSPVTITKSSGWKVDPGANPIGTNSCPSSPCPKAKAAKVVANNMRSRSEEDPLKSPMTRSLLIQFMTPAQMAPSTTPQNKVATKRQVLAKTILQVFILNSMHMAKIWKV